MLQTEFERTAEIANMAVEIAKVLDQASPTEYLAGLDWYKSAHAQAARIAEFLDCSISTAVKLVAVLSPRTAWTENLSAAWKIARHYQSGGTFEDYPKNSRILPANIRKAFIILSGDESALHGQKVEAFADNILDYQSSRQVTVDGWAYRIALGLVGITDELPHAIKPNRYLKAAEAYQQVADQTGLLPLEVQAITWVVAHRLDNKPL